MSLAGQGSLNKKKKMKKMKTEAEKEVYWMNAGFILLVIGAVILERMVKG